MKKLSMTILLSLSALTGAAYAQTDSGIRMSTDAARVADIEQRASDLRAHPQTMESASVMPETETREEATPHRKAAHHKKAAHHWNAAQSKAEPADTVNQ
jgi:hypothetical protein